jgi:hypothetical protein
MIPTIKKGNLFRNKNKPSQIVLALSDIQTTSSDDKFGVKGEGLLKLEGMYLLEEKSWMTTWFWFEKDIEIIQS